MKDEALRRMAGPRVLRIMDTTATRRTWELPDILQVVERELDAAREVDRRSQNEIAELRSQLQGVVGDRDRANMNEQRLRRDRDYWRNAAQSRNDQPSTPPGAEAGYYRQASAPSQGWGGSSGYGAPASYRPPGVTASPGVGWGTNQSAQCGRASAARPDPYARPAHADPYASAASAPLASSGYGAQYERAPAARPDPYARAASAPLAYSGYGAPALPYYGYSTGQQAGGYDPRNPYIPPSPGPGGEAGPSRGSQPQEGQRRR